MARKGSRWRASGSFSRSSTPRTDAWSGVHVHPPYLASYVSPLAPIPPIESRGLDGIEGLLSTGAYYANGLPSSAIDLSASTAKPSSRAFISGLPNEPEKTPIKAVQLQPLPQRYSPPIEAAFVSELSGIDHVLFWKAASKKREAKRRFIAALRAWEAVEGEWELATEANAKTSVEAEAQRTKAERKIEDWRKKAAPHQAQLERYHKQFDEHEARCAKERADDVSKLAEISHAYEVGDPATYFELVLKRSPYPAFLATRPKCTYHQAAKILEVSIDLIDFGEVIEAAVRDNAERPKFMRRPIPTKAERAKLRDEAPLMVLIRTLHEAAKADDKSRVEVFVVNGHLQWNDRATGLPRYEVVCSVQATRLQAATLALANLSAKDCFRSLKGVRSAGLGNGDPTPVMPVLQVEKDGRVVEGKAVLDANNDSNLIDMEWEDFEHLVREVFAKEFASTSARVDVTRASRDWGVDAIVQDPDPIRGGKFVIQAKKYSNVVGVDAVRDLYGTIVNEGANRGILVSTSHFGPQSYEFAKGKPITLIDGSGLLGLLQKHGYKYRISRGG